MKMKNVLPLLTAVFVAMPLAAQKLVDISACASMTKDAERFACYDDLARKAGAMAPAQTSATPAPTPSSATAAARSIAPTAAPAASGTAAPTAPGVAKSSVAESSGKSADSERPAQTAADTPAVRTTSDSSRIAAFGAAISKALLQTDTEGKEMLLDVVTSARFYKQDIWQITLSSGQIWRQVNARIFSLREGDKVQIAPSGWGKSYRLTVEGRSGFIQVERLDNKGRK